jgi:hypothetical protein
MILSCIQNIFMHARIKSWEIPILHCLFAHIGSHLHDMIQKRCIKINHNI